MTRPTEILIGASVRALAEEALENGRRPICIDQFGDRDLLERLADHQLPHYRIKKFEQVVELNLAKDLPVILSGGAEHCELLYHIFDGRLTGTKVERRSRLKPSLIFPACERAGISVPDWSLSCPDVPDGWVAKQMTGSGGTHICTASEAGVGAYFQQRTVGRPVSALFEARADECQLLATMIQFCGRKELNAPDYFFCGNSGPAPLGEVNNAIALAVGSFSTQYFGITGIFGVDFLRTGEQLLPIDWNLRPPASLELFRLSRQFFDGAELQRWIIYADDQTLVDERLSDSLMDQTRNIGERPPNFWLADVPPPDTHVPGGTPFCSLYSLVDSTQAAVNRINRLLPETARFKAPKV